MGSASRLLASLLPWLPRSVVARVARRYVAETHEEVLAVAGRFHRRGVGSTLDILGENVEERGEALDVTEEYLGLLDELTRHGLPSHVSVKLTHVGLRIDEDLAFDNIERLVRRAEELGTFVRIDMEDSSTTDASLRIFRGLRASRTAVGLAIQAYLRRSRADLESLLELRPDLRICKGIYREPPAIAFQERQEIRESFLALARPLLEAGGRVALATHDPWLVVRSLDLLRELAVAPERHEFQMLLGVGHEPRPRIRAAGSRLRIYCPFGPRWYDYSLRRLRENPHVAGYIVKDLLKGLVGRGRS